MVLLLRLLPLGIDLDWKSLSCIAVKSQFCCLLALVLLLGSTEPVRCTPSPACRLGVFSSLLRLASDHGACAFGEGTSASCLRGAPSELTRWRPPHVLSLCHFSLDHFIFTLVNTPVLKLTVFQLIIFKFNFWGLFSLNYEIFLCCDIFDFQEFCTL